MSTLTNDPYVKALCRGADTSGTVQYYEKRMAESPSYTVAEVDYQQFRIYGYQSPRTWSQWGAKKLSHLVGPALNGIQIPFHLFKGITTGPCLGTFRKDMYHVGTDFQRIWGNVKGLAWLPRGEHELASADFHDKCYDMMRHRTRNESSKTVISQKRLDLMGSGTAYIGLTQEELDKVPPRDIPDVVKSLNSERLYVLKFSEDQLKAIPLESLSQVQIHGLFPPFNLSKGENSSALFSELLARQRKGEKQKQKVAFERLRVFSFVELEAIKDKLPPECLELHRVAMAYNDLKRLGLTKQLFDHNTPEIIVQALLMESLEETIQRLHTMELELLHKLLPHLTLEILIKLDDKTLNTLDFSNLTQIQLDQIFDTRQKSAKQPFINRLTAEQINAVIPRLEVIQIQTFELSNAQLKQLDLKTLSLRQLQALLPLNHLSEFGGDSVNVAMQKKFAEKQLMVLQRMNAFEKKAQQDVIKEKLPELWDLYQAWKTNDTSNPQVSALDHLMKVVIEMPKKPEKKPELDPESLTEVTDKMPDTLFGKIHYYALAFLTHVWNGLCFVTRIVTYPIWKPYTVIKGYFSAKESVEPKDDKV